MILNCIFRSVWKHKGIAMEPRKGLLQGTNQNPQTSTYSFMQDLQSNPYPASYFESTPQYQTKAPPPYNHQYPGFLGELESGTDTLPGMLSFYSNNYDTNLHWNQPSQNAQNSSQWGLGQTGNTQQNGLFSNYLQNFGDVTGLTSEFSIQPQPQQQPLTTSSNLQQSGGTPTAVSPQGINQNYSSQFTSTQSISQTSSNIFNTDFTLTQPVKQEPYPLYNTPPVQDPETPSTSSKVGSPASSVLPAPETPIKPLPVSEAVTPNSLSTEFEAVIGPVVNKVEPVSIPTPPSNNGFSEPDITQEAVAPPGAEGPSGSILDLDAINKANVEYMDTQGAGFTEDSNDTVISTSSSSNLGDKCYKCEHCDKQFPHKKQLSRHVKEMHKKDVFNCGVCGQVFTRIDNMRRHEKAHGEDNRYKCDVCDRSYQIQSKLIEHKRIHTGEKPYKCHFCEKVFRTSVAVNKHMKVHSSEKPFSCTLCGRGFNQLEQMERHLKTHDKKTYLCNVCGKLLASEAGLKLHMLSHEKTDKDEETDTDLEEEDDEEDPNIPDSQRPHQCSTCKKRFAKKSSLSNHIKKHRQVNPFKCDICSREFVRLGNFETHVDSHSPEKKIQRQNKKATPPKKELTEEEKPYQCNVCGRCFAKTSSLSNHIKTHNGEKPFRCEHCGKTFVRQACFNQHVASHAHSTEKLHQVAAHVQITEKIHQMVTPLNNSVPDNIQHQMTFQQNVAPQVEEMHQMAFQPDLVPDLKNNGIGL